MKYLLDTCVISDFVKGVSKVGTKLLSFPPYEISISTVTQMEIEYGLLLNKERALKLRPAIEALFKTIKIFSFTSEDSLSAAEVRLLLKTSGKPIGPYDVMIAGCALNRKLVLVTSNTSEFERVKGLKIENWREE